MGERLPPQPWHAERQWAPSDRLWILDREGLLVGRYDLASGEVRCCRPGAAAALDAYLAGWYAATLVTAPNFPPPTGRPVAAASLPGAPVWTRPGPSPYDKSIGSVPPAVPASGTRPHAGTEPIVLSQRGPVETVHRGDAPVPPPRRGRPARSAPEESAVGTFIDDAFRTGQPGSARRARP